MPRPTPAQIAYGSATVVFSAAAMLLLTPTGSALMLGALALAALVLGCAVAVAVPARSRRERQAADAAARLPERRTPAHAGSTVGEHPLHG
ncbi:hypothetical protein [Streptomyces sp. UNOB3_S3]|uniref:hypothetical protein n=1 Tax=Streptomyces sp. UNOB3_S3 TaxID=2871682 RepID=UPI001E3902C2|nr:hypothetical protein [Streptomyces sp. UNOB3_S3]MCC3776961.1 hypothetical protein [Streptomyces sp. UNOB3_S3]